MAVCNLLTDLNNASGNFIMFSQYVEDITKNYASGDDYKVVPSRFVALNIDYSKVELENLNTSMPKYFQNCFENACAYGRSNYSTWSYNTSKANWSPEISRNLFWNCMFDGKLLSAVKYGADKSDVKYIPEIVYFGDINMHSYNNHQGMGYGEIYCYIPTDGNKMRCQVKCITDDLNDSRVYDARNTKSHVEGYPNILLEHEIYPQKYYYNEDFKVLVNTDINGRLNNSSDQYYDVNTIVVLYSVFQKVNDTWNVLHEDIPMGIYFAGKFENKKLTNTITKYVTTSYGAGTAYGLRICTRFSATSNGQLFNTDVITDDTGYVNMCQLMTAMNENLSKMLDVTRAAVDTRENYKELLSVLQNNKINVPYVKNINGTDFWFVNGKLVSRVDQGTSLAYGYLDEAVIQQRIDNLSDDDPTNDYTDIRDPLDLDAEEIPATELANALGMYEIMNPMPTE